MTWFRSRFGLDGVDTVIHVGVTLCAFAMATIAFDGTLGTILGFKVIAISLVAFAWRRNRALKRMSIGGELGLTSGQMAADRLAEMEPRLGDLEAAQSRVAELEERLDFTERMLASGERDPLPVRGAAHG